MEGTAASSTVVGSREPPAFDSSHRRRQCTFNRRRNLEAVPASTGNSTRYENAGWPRGTPLRRISMNAPTSARSPVSQRSPCSCFTGSSNDRGRCPQSDGRRKDRQTCAQPGGGYGPPVEIAVVPPPGILPAKSCPAATSRDRRHQQCATARRQKSAAAVPRRQPCSQDRQCPYFSQRCRRCRGRQQRGGRVPSVVVGCTGGHLFIRRVQR